MKTKVLITVKTYPTLSTKYDELVCTAGFTEDGEWIRIYPVEYRKKDYITNGIYKELYKVSDKTAYRHLDELVKLDVLIKTGEKKGTRYEIKH